MSNKDKRQNIKKNQDQNGLEKTMAMELIVKKMKRLIGVLSVALVISVGVIIFMIISPRTANQANTNSINTTKPGNELVNPYDVKAVSTGNTTSGEPAVSSLDSTTAQPAATPKAKINAPPIGSIVKLNPPHGQPGHRCEIPVGSPL